jgi:hypothetical protein
MAPRETSGPTVIAGYDSSEAVVCDLSVGTIVPLPRTATERAFLTDFAQQTLWLPTQPAGMMSKISMSRIWTIADVEMLIRQTQRNRPARTGDKNGRRSDRDRRVNARIHQADAKKTPVVLLDELSDQWHTFSTCPTTQANKFVK